MGYIGEDFVEYIVEDIYDTLIGDLEPDYRVPGVENAYAPGSRCDKAYHRVMDAYERLLDRLGLVDEDKDVEIIINSMMEIQQDLCERMFRLGVKFAEAQQSDRPDAAAG